MNTKELIEKLNQIDPDGVMEVCVHNRDIGSIYSEPAYWDGRLQKVTKRDKYGRPLETTVTTSGSKITLSPVDLSDTYIDSILEDGEEYTILTSGGLPKSYSWLDADWMARKVDWLIWSEKYLESYGESYDESEKKLEFIRNLKEQYVGQCRSLLVEYAKKNFKRKQKTSAIKLIEKLTEKRPIILDVFRHGKEYAAMSGANWRGYEFMVYKDGVVKQKTFREKEWREINLDEFDFDEVVEKFDEMQNRRYNE